ncbi:MAG TPA: hypothetical protein ENN80_02455 [Candidatus Hydrogenedentes bacterium]|nr:hypothetical protein [Candidatus Hydrogenedentota bacterium]
MSGRASGATTPGLEWIRLGDDGARFVYAESGTEFVAWGVNYDHDRSGRLIEDYWHDEWAAIVEDFAEIKALGANVVRIHLQTGKFMKAPDEADVDALQQLERLLKMAEDTGVYLDLTGLGCYHKQDVPAWYDTLDEAARWDVQARFWAAVATTCADSPAVFCYDLMNEPIVPGPKKKETDWLAGEFGGKYFVQRIALDLAGRTREEVAKAWVDKLASAIRKHDKRHLITLGIIPWALHFYPGARQSLFYSKPVGEHLDFVSVHFYPEKGQLDKALDALSVYDLGKPLVIEEMFPLKCSAEELESFIDGSRAIAEGWISFYWGKTIDEYAAEEDSLTSALVRTWLERFRAMTPAILGTAEAISRTITAPAEEQ